MTAADLVAFLRERLDEDEQVARAATVGPWTVDSMVYPEAIHSDSTAVVSGGRWGGEASVFESTEDAIHIARHDPARVLAEVEAKRRMIEEPWGGPDHHDLWEHHLRLLALPYADHPDYREEWRP